MAFKDREHQRRYQRAWKARRRSEFLADKRCVRCGGVERLELDHIDPAKKISHKIWSWTVERRKAELAKCQVLCHQCHVDKSIEQMPETHGVRPHRHGTSSTYNNGCRCEMCREAHRDRARSYREKNRRS